MTTAVDDDGVGVIVASVELSAGTLSKFNIYLINNPFFTDLKTYLVDLK